jgi:sulfide:quinone oxidoreductase
VSGFRAVICGGGIAAVEGLLRLRRLAGEAVEISLLAPNEELVMRPQAVREPFAYASAERYPLRRIVGDADADWVQDRLAWVDRDAREVHTGEAHGLPYDALLVAVGARLSPPYEHVTVFDDAHADETYRGLVQDVEEGYSRRLVFTFPPGPAYYPLPIYELALMTAERAYSMGIEDVEVHVVTPEPAPLAAFGSGASEAVGKLLRERRITVHPSSAAHVSGPGRVVVQPLGEEIEADRIVSMPQVSGPSIRGLPGDPHGFIPIDRFARIAGEERLFAAGDATARPLKHGGLGAHEADVAAARIAALAGVEVEPARVAPVIHGMLLTGRRPVYLRARMVAGVGFESEVFAEPPWSPTDKVVAEELGPYLAELEKQT